VEELDKTFFQFYVSRKDEMETEKLTAVARRYKALAHPARLRMLAMLRTGELCVCQIIAPLRLAPSTVSAHLAELRRSGLLEERKQGRWVYYGLSRNRMAERLFEILWPALETDPQVAADAAVVAKLREVSVDELCRVSLDLEQLGIVVQRGVRKEHRKQA